MKRIFRLTSVLLAVILMIGTLSFGVTANAADNPTSGTFADVTWKFDAATGTLTITGSGSTGDKNGTTPWLEYYQADVKKIVVGEGITQITKSFFAGMNNVSEVSLPSTLTTIGEDAFQNIKQLERITLPDGLKTVDRFAFMYCSKLKEVNFPKNATFRAWAFDFCGFTEVDIPDSFEGEIGSYCFDNCGSLESVHIGKSVKKIGRGAFAGCPKLSKLAVSDGNPNYCARDNVLFSANMKSLEFYPEGLTAASYTVPEGVVTIGEYSFDQNKTITKITLPQGVVRLNEGAFRSCTNLTQINFPDSISVIETDALKNIGWINAQPDGVIYIGRIAFQCKGSCPASITLRSGTTSIAPQCFAGQSTLKSIEIPSTVTLIGKSAFSETGLESVEIPDSVTELGNNAFFSCADLSSVKIGKGIRKINPFTFSKLSSLTELEIPEGVQIIDEFALHNDNALKKLTVPKSVTYVGYYAFGYSTVNNVYASNAQLTVYLYRNTVAETYCKDKSLYYVLLDGDEPSSKLLGDTDGDGAVTIFDATVIQQKMASIPVSSFDQAAADADGDGVISVLDATAIQRWLAGLKTNDAIGKPVK